MFIGSNAENKRFYAQQNSPLSADVGGMMGLFLGASIFTILEVATKLSKKLYKHSKKKESVTSWGGAVTSRYNELRIIGQNVLRGELNRRIRKIHFHRRASVLIYE